METFEVPLQPILVFVVVLARLGGMISLAPFWGNRGASPKIRVVLSLVLAIALTPVIVPRIPELPSETGPLMLIVVGEFIIGSIFGFIGRLVFSGIEVATHMISSQMGFSLAGTIDPSTSAQTTAFGIIAQMLALMVLLAADGHHWFLAATVKSFSTTAPGTFVMSASVLDLLLRISANALVVGVTLAAPAVIVLLAIEFALEFFGRTAPQFQVFILGFPIKIGAGLVLIGASMYFIPGAVRNVIGGVYDGLAKALGLM